jgi:acetyl-CoA carboxylase carboxyl transferase subunit beta
VLTDPTSGGISASFCFLGDLVIAEPKALIAFTGARHQEHFGRDTAGRLPAPRVPAGARRHRHDRRPPPMRAELAALLALLLDLPRDAVA